MYSGYVQKSQNRRDFQILVQQPGKRKSVRFVPRPILLCLKNVDSNFSVKVKLMTFVKPKSKNLKGKRGMVAPYTPVPIEWKKKNALAMSR